MECCHIIWLENQCLFIVLLRSVHFTLLLPAECSIVICFEMLIIQLNCFRVVCNSQFILLFFPQRETTIVIEIGLGIFHTDRCRKTFNCLVKISHPVKTDAFVVISESVIWIYLNCCRVILNSKFKVTQFVISKTPVEKCFEMDGVNLQCFCVQLNS